MINRVKLLSRYNLKKIKLEREYLLTKELQNFFMIFLAAHVQLLHIKAGWIKSFHEMLEF